MINVVPLTVSYTGVDKLKVRTADNDCKMKLDFINSRHKLKDYI